MSKHHNPRNSMMPAPPQPNPEPERDTSPPMRAYAVNRTSEGWDLRVLLLPPDVVEQYTVKQNADVLPIVIAKLAMDIERVAEGRAGMEHSAIEAGIICLTVLVIGWLGRGAHDMRLRLESERMRLAADTKAAEREPAAWDAYRERVHGVERRLERVEKGVEDLNTATALGRRRR